jgi:hypothetical protein
MPSETPRLLVIPERDLFTGIAIVGAVGSGKTASCMYPFVEQILAYRDEDYCGADKDDPIYYATAHHHEGSSRATTTKQC